MSGGVGVGLLWVLLFAQRKIRKETMTEKHWKAPRVGVRCPLDQDGSVTAQTFFWGLNAPTSEQR